MESLVFQRPWALWFLPLIAYVLWRLWQGRANSLWSDYMDAELFDHAFGSSDAHTRRIPWIITTILLYAALVGAGTLQRNDEGYRADEGWVIAIDASESMSNTLELGMSRFAHAKSLAKTLIENASPRAVAVLVYSADAYLISPYSSDHADLIDQINLLTLDMMPLGGTRPDRAISLALPLAQQAGLARQRIILIADGVGSARLIQRPDQSVDALLIDAQPSVDQRAWLDKVTQRTFGAEEIDAFVHYLQRGVRVGSSWLGVNERVEDLSWILILAALPVVGWILWRE